jgi:CHAT domain-containing protein/Tfp pilus assembly protein PilF
VGKRVRMVKKKIKPLSDALLAANSFEKGKAILRRRKKEVTKPFLRRFLKKLQKMQDQGEIEKSLLGLDFIIYCSNWFKDIRLKIDGLNEKARGLFQFDRYKEGIKLCREIQNILKPLKDKRRMGRVLLITGHLENRLGHLLQAEKAYQEAMVITEETGDKADRVDIFLGLGGIYHAKGDLKKSLQYEKRALRLTRKIKPSQRKVREAGTLINIGLIYLLLGDLVKALHYLKRAQTLNKKLNAKYNEVFATSNIGNLYILLGELSLGLAVQKEALDLSREVGIKQVEAMILQGMGSVYKDFSDYQQALKLSKDSYSILREISEPRNQVVSLVQIATIYMRLAQLKEARKSLLKALALVRKGGFQVEEAFALSVMGEVEFRSNHHSEALDSLQKALSLSRHTRHRILETKTMLQIAHVNLRLNRLKDAERYAQSALDLAKRIKEPEGICSAHYTFGIIQKRRKKWDLALDAFKQSIAAVEKLRSKLTTQEFRIGFMKGKTEPYYEIILLLLKMNRFAEAFNYTEKAKSRALLDLLDANRIPIVSKERKLTKEERILRARIDFLLKKYQENIEAKDTRSLYLKNIYKTDLDRLEEEYAELEERLLKKSPEYYALANAKTLTLEQIQEYWKPSKELFGQDTGLIEYFIAYSKDRNGEGKALVPQDERLITFVLGSKGLVTQQAIAGYHQIKEDFEAFQHEIMLLESLGKEKRSQAARESIHIVQKLLGRLYDQLLGPISEHLEDFKELKIIPHGFLHHLPFGALFNSRSQRYLIEDFTLSQSPSASVLRSCFEKNSLRKDRCLVMGIKDERLPYAEEEVQRVSRKFQSDRRKIFFGNRVTLKNLQTHFGNEPIFHFVGHAVFRTDKPFESYLQLPRHKRLTASDLFSLSLRSDISSLVTLSACETGMSEVTGGDELIGLTRGFMYAGAPSLLVSLWRVADESTAILMDQFYSHYKRGLDKASSLRLAQLDLLKENQFSHPYFWTPFVLIGDHR